MPDARVDWGNEPPTPRWVEWRLAIYPLALGVGALAMAYESPLLFLVFAVTMLAPLWIKWRAWGGVVKAFEWMFKSNLRVTREGFLFVVLVVLFGVAAINTGTNLLYLILAMMLSIMVLSTWLANANLRNLRISRRLPAYVFAGEEFRMHLLVTNPRKRMPALAVDAFERAGPFAQPGGKVGGEGPHGFFFLLEPGERRPYSWTMTLPRRGVYPLEGFILTTRFPFGFATQFARADLPGEILVFPAPRELVRDALRNIGATAEALRTRSLIHSPEEFRSLREYRPGDNPRWIHWKSSARRGVLLVKEWEPRSSRRAAIVLDSDVGPRPKANGAAPPAVLIEKLDRGCTLAVSLIEHLVHDGERPEFAVLTRGEVARFASEQNPRDVAALLECLARLVPEEDAECAGVAEAAVPAIRRGARVYVLSAREPGKVRHAIERREPGAAFAVEVIPFAEEAQVARFYGSRGTGAGTGTGTGTGTAVPK